MPAGVGGDADEAGDDIEYVGKGVSRDELSEGYVYNIDDTHPLWWYGGGGCSCHCVQVVWLFLLCR